MGQLLPRFYKENWKLEWKPCDGNCTGNVTLPSVFNEIIIRWISNLQSANSYNAHLCKEMINSSGFVVSNGYYHSATNFEASSVKVSLTSVINNYNAEIIYVYYR